jgi:hypothetical protein
MVAVMASIVCISTCVPAAEVYGARLDGHTKAWNGRRNASSAKFEAQDVCVILFWF